MAKTRVVRTSSLNPAYLFWTYNPEEIKVPCIVCEVTVARLLKVKGLPMDFHPFKTLEEAKAYTKAIRLIVGIGAKAYIGIYFVSIPQLLAVHLKVRKYAVHSILRVPGLLTGILREVDLRETPSKFHVYINGNKILASLFAEDHSEFSRCYFCKKLPQKLVHKCGISDCNPDYLS